jgi:hypothetical protein
VLRLCVAHVGNGMASVDGSQITSGPNAGGAVYLLPPLPQGQPEDHDQEDDAGDEQR